jgi:hypothetical protein
MSFFVLFLYSVKAAAKMVSKFGGEVEVDGSFGSWDIVWSKRSGWIILERKGCNEGRNEGKGQRAKERRF